MTRVAVVGPQSGPRAAWGELLTDAVATAQHSPVEWVMFDDRGDASEARTRAEEVVADGGFTAVIGHFNSLGARAALPVYREAGLPVLLPLATAPGLLRATAPIALRLCPDDDGQVAALVQACRGYEDVRIMHDGGDYGAALALRVSALAPSAGLHGPSDGPVRADAVIVCGTHHGVAGLLRDVEVGARRIVVSDDCDVPEFADMLGERAAAASVARLAGGPYTRVVAAVTAVASVLSKRPSLRGDRLLEALRAELALDFTPDGDLADGSSGAGWEIGPVRPPGSQDAGGTQVAVVGGGLVGLSAAAELAESGAQVVLWDGGTQTSASAVSGGLVRAFEPGALQRRLAIESFTTHWNGGRCAGRYEFRRTGSLVLFGPEQRDDLPARSAELHRAGITAEVLEPADIARRWPDLDVTGLGGAVWEPAAGYAVAAVALAAARDRALRAGVTIRRERVSELTALDAREVLVAAGCGTPGLVGDQWPRDRPTWTKRIRYGIFGRGGRSVPTIVDLTSGLWARPDGADGILVGVPVQECDVPVESGGHLTEDQVTTIREGARERLPFLAGAPFLTGRYGTDLYVADGPVIATLPGSRRVAVATAGSGGGFKSAPAAGRLAATELLARPRADLTGRTPG